MRAAGGPPVSLSTSWIGTGIIIIVVIIVIIIIVIIIIIIVVVIIMRLFRDGFLWKVRGIALLT